MFILFLVVILALTNYSWSTPEGLIEYLGNKPTGYFWYPIIIKYDNQEKLNKFLAEVKYKIRPCIKTFIDQDLTKPVSYSEREVIKEISKRTVFSPKEVLYAIKDLKSNVYLIGFMRSSDTLEIDIEGKTFYIDDLYQEAGITKSWSIVTRLKRHNQIFNLVIDIDILPTY
jgi:hypothetical protein